MRGRNDPLPPRPCATRRPGVPAGCVTPQRWPCRLPRLAASVVGVGSGPGSSARLDPNWFEAVRQESRALRQSSEEARARARAIRDQIRRGRSRRQVLHDSVYARLLARQETLSAIEQAKGIIMAQQRCGPQEAFDLLRRASQRTNVKLHVLAAQLVEHIAASDDHGNVIAIALGAMQSRGEAPPRTGTGRS